MIYLLYSPSKSLQFGEIKNDIQRSGPSAMFDSWEYALKSFQNQIIDLWLLRKMIF